MTDDVTWVMDNAEMEAAEGLAEARLVRARTQPSDASVEVRVREYLRRPYRLEVRGGSDDGYLARAPELPGCITAGKSPGEALRMLRDAMATWLESAIVAGDPIPEPDDDRYSGRILLRMPRSLHARLAEQARRENVSINHLAMTFIAEGVGRGQSGLAEEIARRVALLDPGSMPREPSGTKEGPR